MHQEASCKSHWSCETNVSLFTTERQTTVYNFRNSEFERNYLTAIKYYCSLNKVE